MTRLLLVEFLSDNIYRQHRSEAYPFIQGYARRSDVDVRWVALVAGSESRRGSYFIVDPPAERAAALVGAARAFAPTVVVLNEKTGPALSALLGEALPDARVVTIGEDTPRRIELTVDEVAAWLGLPAPPGDHARGRLIADHGEPDHTSETLNPEAIGARHFVQLQVSVPCTYVRPVAASPAFEGVDLGGCTRLVGCSFCQGIISGSDDVIARSPVKPAAELALTQLRRFLETAPPERRSDAYMVNGAALFFDLADFFAGLMTLPLPPSTFHFARRVDEFLVHADTLEAWLPRLADKGHKVVLWAMGMENFSPAENARLNKGVRIEQVEEAFARLRTFEERWPETSVFFDYGGASMIAFTPWTRLEDLEINLDALERLSIDGALYLLTTRLLLLPGIPVAALAERDGLVRERFEQPMPEPTCCLDFWDDREIP